MNDKTSRLKHNQKLRLHKETVRELTAGEAQVLAGGGECVTAACTVVPTIVRCVTQFECGPKTACCPRTGPA